MLSFLPNTLRIDYPNVVFFFKVVYTKMILGSVNCWNRFSGDKLNYFNVYIIQ